MSPASGARFRSKSSSFPGLLRHVQSVLTVLVNRSRPTHIPDSRRPNPVFAGWLQRGNPPYPVSSLGLAMAMVTGEIFPKRFNLGVMGSALAGFIAGLLLVSLGHVKLTAHHSTSLAEAVPDAAGQFEPIVFG